MENLKNFAFILLTLIQCSSHTVFSARNKSKESSVSYILIETVDDVCTTIDECKFECCQLSQIHDVATNRCSTKPINQQLSDVNWKSPFSAYHKLSCESLCSKNIAEERVREDVNFGIFMDNVTSTRLCNNIIDICYSYSVAHWRNFDAMDSFRRKTLPIVEESLSIIFMSVTLLLYLAVPELCRRIQDKCFLVYLGFRIANFSTRFMLLFSKNDDFSCKFYAFVIQFSGLAANFWLNVISFHMWRCTNSVIPVFQSSSRTIRRYSLYACGCSLLITVITYFAGFWLPVEFKSLKPRIGEQFCEIISYDRHSGKQPLLQPQFIYYFSVLSVLQIMNLGAFFHIVFIIQSNEKRFRRKDSEALRRHQTHRQGFLTYRFVRLILLMSLTTILEIIFFHFGRSAVEKLSLRLVSAFLLSVVFIYNKRVICAVKKRFPQLTS